MMAKPTLLPDPTCLHLQLLDASTTTIILVVTTTSEETVLSFIGVHPECTLATCDRSLICPGWAVPSVCNCMCVAFSAPTRECVRQIFTERLPNVVAPYARHTTRLIEVLTLIGFALGGEAGKRLASGMSLVTSPDSLLRLVRARPEEPVPTPRPP